MNEISSGLVVDYKKDPLEFPKHLTQVTNRAYSSFEGKQALILKIGHLALAYANLFSFTSDAVSQSTERAREAIENGLEIEDFTFVMSDAFFLAHTLNELRKKKSLKNTQKTLTLTASLSEKLGLLKLNIVTSFLSSVLDLRHMYLKHKKRCVYESLNLVDKNDSEKEIETLKRHKTYITTARLVVNVAILVLQSIRFATAITAVKIASAALLSIKLTLELFKEYKEDKIQEVRDRDYQFIPPTGNALTYI